MSCVLDWECPQMSTNASVCRRMNSTLRMTSVSAYDQRMSEHFIRISYVSLIRSSVTEP